jgi:hypothetical protein
MGNVKNKLKIQPGRERTGPSGSEQKQMIICCEHGNGRFVIKSGCSCIQMCKPT